MEFHVSAPVGLPEIVPGDDIGGLVCHSSMPLADGDIVAVTSKIVSKAEGRIVAADDREAAIDSQTVRIVAQRMRPDGTSLRIVENPLGLVMAAAGVDASNTPAGTVLLLPSDPDASARTIRATIAALRGVNVAVIITDTVGRPWRAGLTDIAIGAAGILPIVDYRGHQDTAGRELSVTQTALIDELASASEIVRGKTDGRPIAVIRGLAGAVLPAGNDGEGARQLVRLGPDDLFAQGSQEAFDAGYAAGLAAARQAQRAGTDAE
ncbi:coenzyme F420-0:L-glutamate ligase [Jonesia quinghaiensis]|uniref:coenzyme F420-0:L-glutamate ligase n=1 Tax=Jonesia quinghaiensis TaxID=262806 RepID=UPI000569330F|nr:coenzyme F420-0:L-glutamate ligase [Jonesia quinghaiensis]